MKTKVLILYAHRDSENSTVNRAMADAVRDLVFVTLVDLYALYPDFKIDRELELKRIRDHDIIIFQFPMHWFSTPALLKEYQDCLFTGRHAYGPDGKAFSGKSFFCATSTGAAEDKFGAGNRNTYSVDQFFRAQEQTMRAIGMDILPHFVFYGASTANDDQLQSHVDGWIRLLRKLLQR